MNYRIPVFLIALVLSALAGPASAGAARLQSWAELLDKAAARPAPEREGLVKSARDAAEAEIFRRADRLEDVGKHRTWLDGRSAALEDEIKEVFALAMSDFAACNSLSKELPLLAAAYRLSGEKAFLDRVTAQLEELATWSPLQRPGWTCYAPGNRLPADGKDGNWLATGCGVRAIADTLELLPEGAVDKTLVAKLHLLLESEVVGVVDDWASKRPWFVRSNNAVTNQWVLPTEGLIRACLVLGAEDRREAYELGVANLLAALNAHGEQGEFEEGYGYASFTVTSLLHAAHAMAVAGDRRAIDHPFLAHFATWLVHHYQPGNMVINCFDAGRAYDAARGSAPLLSLLAVCTGGPVARWALAHYLEGPSDDLAGLAARGLLDLPASAAPPLFAYYDRARRVNWRSGWEDGATGVWVRGGHRLDQHDHQDRGHVNVIAGGKPLLIEAGTPSYHHKLMMTHYTTGVGHNVLQIGAAFPERLGKAGEYVSYPGWQKRGGIAPIEVRRLDGSGGEVVVDGTACYEGLERWRRTVSWSANAITVVDDVALAGDTEELILFRWHLGTEEEARLDSEGETHRVAWNGVTLTLTATAPLTLEQIQMPDHTLAGHTGGEDPGNVHTCIVVRTSERRNALELTTQVSRD